jgi:hypothetical protein
VVWRAQLAPSGGVEAPHLAGLSALPRSQRSWRSEVVTKARRGRARPPSGRHVVAALGCRSRFGMDESPQDVVFTEL